MKGAVSAQKALQGSEIETKELLGGAEGKSIFADIGAIDFPSSQIDEFLIKGNRKILSLWADLVVA